MSGSELRTLEKVLDAVCTARERVRDPIVPYARDILKPANCGRDSAGGLCYNTNGVICAQNDRAKGWCAAVEGATTGCVRQIGTGSGVAYGCFSETRYLGPPR